jgi:hypothetical protein
LNKLSLSPVPRFLLFINNVPPEQKIDTSWTVSSNYLEVVYGKELVAGLGKNPSVEQILKSIEGIKNGHTVSPFLGLDYVKQLNLDKNYREIQHHTSN